MNQSTTGSDDSPILRRMTPEELQRYNQILSKLTPDQQILWQQLQEYQQLNLMDQYNSSTGMANDGLQLADALQRAASGDLAEGFIPESFATVEHNVNSEVAKEWQDQLVQEAEAASAGSASEITSGTQYYSTDGGQTWHLFPSKGSPWPWDGWLFGGVGLLGILAAVILSFSVAITRACDSMVVPNNAATQPEQNSTSSSSHGNGVPNSDSSQASGPDDRYTVHESAPTPHFNITPDVGDPDWEPRLQRERMDAIVRGDMVLYNELVQKDTQIYRQYGVNPCDSSYFKEGCQQ